MASVAVVTLVACGLLAVAYGAVVMHRSSGTYFHAVWYALGIALLGAAQLTRTGAWFVLPPWAAAALVTSLAVATLSLAVSCACVVGGMRTHPSAGLDYVVVLGAQVWPNGQPSRILRQRLDAANAYLRENPACTCVVSGGRGPNEPCSEAEGMASYLRHRGLAPERVVCEATSRNTVQNVAFSKRIVDGRERDEGLRRTYRVGIVTSDFHVYRSVRIARKAGWVDACGIAARSTRFYLPNNLLRESLGLIKDFLLGNLG